MVTAHVTIETKMAKVQIEKKWVPKCFLDLIVILYHMIFSCMVISDSDSSFEFTFLNIAKM